MSRDLTFKDGLRALFSGVRYVMGTPRVWPLAAVPAVLCAVTVSLTTWATYLGVMSYTAPFLDPQSTLGAVLLFVLSVVVFLVALLFGGLVGLALAQPLSAPALDALAKHRARALGKTTFLETSIPASAFRSLRVVSLGLAFGLPLLLVLSLVTLLFPVASVVTLPLKFLVAAWLATWDVFDYAFGLEAVGVADRLRWLGRHGMAGWAFGVALATVALVPFLGLFVLPFGVAGATELWLLSQTPKEAPETAKQRHL